MSRKQSITHNNHYVPQFYLKHWSNNGNTIHSYNGIIRHASKRKWSSSPIKSSACLPDYYTDEIDGADDDKVEKLFQQYENNAKPIFKRVLQGQDLSSTELHVLIDYLIAQIARTPAFYGHSNETAAILFPSLFEQAMRKIEQRFANKEFGDQLREIKRRDAFLPLNLKHNEEDGTVTAETCVGRHMFLSNAQQFLNSEVASLLKHARWRIMKSKDSLLTSDNPVVFLRFNRESGGWITGLKAIEEQDLRAVYLPLSPHHLFITTLFHSESELDLLEMSDEFCEFIQQGTVLKIVSPMLV